MGQTNSGVGLGQTSEAGVISIDVHHHFNPTLRDNEGNPWSIEMALGELDRNSIPSAIASLGPVNGSDGNERRRQARVWNEWGTRICLDHPGRFGLFASLPLPDIDASLSEIAYVYDVLHADGIAASTSEGDVWLGDLRNEPMFDELNRRKAVVFVHPYATSHCRPLTQSYGRDAISPPWLEFPVNTARAILSVLTNGITRSYPDIRFIFCHGGGVMPLMLARIAGFSGWKTVGTEKLKTLFPDGIYAEFGKLYFDCAQAYAPEVMDLLRRTVPTTHLLFGSDFSYFPISHSTEQFLKLGLERDVRGAIGGDNAKALFPRFRRNEPTSRGAQQTFSNISQ